MKTFRNLVCVTLIAVVASSAIADEKEKKGKGKRARKTPTATQQLLSKIELTDEQKPEVAEIDKQFAEKFTAARKAMSSILTEDQKKTQQTMARAKREAGKKQGGSDSRKELEAALNLSDEQKAKRKEAQTNMRKLQVEVIAALKKVLTSEQQEKLPAQRGRKGARSADGEKPKKKKKDAA